MAIIDIFVDSPFVKKASTEIKDIIVDSPFGKRLLRQLLTPSSLLVRSYYKITNRSTSLSLSSGTLLISFDNSTNTSVTVSNVFHVYQAALFPLPPKNETESQPIRDWKNVKAFDLTSPNARAISCTAIYLKDFRVPKAIHTSSEDTVENTKIARTTTSVSTVRIATNLKPHSAISDT